jgi:hypothetical protein
MKRLLLHLAIFLLAASVGAAVGYIASQFIWNQWEPAFYEIYVPVLTAAGAVAGILQGIWLTGSLSSLPLRGR